MMDAVAVIQIELSQEEMCKLMQEREWWIYCPKKADDDEGESDTEEYDPPLKMML